MSGKYFPVEKHNETAGTSDLSKAILNMFDCPINVSFHDSLCSLCLGVEFYAPNEEDDVIYNRLVQEDLEANLYAPNDFVPM